MNTPVPDLPASGSTSWYPWATAIDAGAREHTVVSHGATATTARPSGFTSVTWVGTVRPNNMTAADLWIGPA